MSVPVVRYKRRKMIQDPNSTLLNYLRPAPGSQKVVTIRNIARDIETIGALSADDVEHVMNAFMKQLRKKLTEGNRVKVDELGTFYITFACTGTEDEKDCTVKNIRNVRIRFLADTRLKLVNDTTATTRGGDNNVSFYIKSATESGGSNPGGDGGGGVIDPEA